jgi:outer membrane receptor for ferrienterochelin and colicins
VGGSYRVTPRFTISAAVYNLFNKDFVDYAPYYQSGNTVTYGNRYRNPQDGRRLWISANYEF